MESLSIGYGLFLIIWGIVLSVADEDFRFIPSILKNNQIIVFSYMSIKIDTKRKCLCI